MPLLEIDNILKTLVIVLILCGHVLGGSLVVSMASEKQGNKDLSDYPGLHQFLTETAIEEESKGWFLYEPIPPIDDQETDEEPAIDQIIINWDAFKKLTTKNMKTIITELRELSIARPKKEYVKNYMIAQKIATGKAAKYMNVWQEVLREHPTLDETVKRPPSGYVSFQLANANQNTIDEVVTSIARDKNVGLVLFYQKGSYYSELQLPILQKVVNRTMWEPYLVLDVMEHQKTANEYGIETVPEIWLVEKNGGKARVTAGLRTADVIRKNILPAYEKIVGKRITREPYKFLDSELGEQIGVE